MALYPTLFGYVDLPRPEALQRDDRHVVTEAGVRLVRPGRAGSPSSQVASRREA
jgi:hypothetical protein